MTPQTLKAIKDKLREFLPVVEKIANHWQYQHHYTLLYVLVQNIVHDSSECVGYEHDVEVAKIHEILSILKSIADYHKSYYESYVYNEVNDFITGMEMAEESTDDSLYHNVLDN